MINRVVKELLSQQLFFGISLFGKNKVGETKQMGADNSEVVCINRNIGCT